MTNLTLSTASRPRSRITTNQLERSFGVGDNTVHALGPIDLDISDGEFVCVVGPSGCGKSTLLRLLDGLVKPSAGTATLYGTPTQDPSTAVVFQDYSIYPWKSVEANVRFGLDMAGVSLAESKPRVDRWLNKMQLSDFRTKYPSALSGGMRQRVSIARAFVTEPDILLMDEPFAALDAQLRHVLQDELLQLWQENQRTVVFITHNLDEAILLGDRVLVMSARPGTVVAEFKIPFERPRDGSIRGSAEFAALEAEIWQALKNEVDTGTKRRDPDTTETRS